MASNFSANQYERAFCAKSLCNWEVPHWYPKHPRRRSQTTRFIANDRGHLLENVERPKSSPWGHFKSTWELPNIISRDFANELSAPQVGDSRWAMPDTNKRVFAKVKNIKGEAVEESAGDSPDIVRSITPFEKEEAPQEEQPKKSLTEKEKLNNPLAIAKGAKRAIRHETLERDNDLH